MFYLESLRLFLLDRQPSVGILWGRRNTMSSDSMCSLVFMSPMENNSNQGLFVKFGKEVWTENLYTLHTRECTKHSGRDKRLHYLDLQVI